MTYPYVQYPHPLDLLLPRVSYKGWKFETRQTDLNLGLNGMSMLVIEARTVDSITGNPDFLVMHEFVIPRVPLSDAEWRRWLLERILLVEQHEACEFFWVDRERPFFPEHGAGANPYQLVDRWE